jgi:hypothetical protein
MTDYTKASGAGDLMIRDLGSTVEFWVRAGYSDFHWDNLSFSTTANGTTLNSNYDYKAGEGWGRVATRTVNTSQTVTFRLLEATGTSSLAGPTTMTAFLDRDDVPSQPDPVTFSSITSTSFVASFTSNSNNGGTVDQKQISYYKGSTTTPRIDVVSDGSTLISGLTPGQLYLVYARDHNYKGWGPYSTQRQVTTLRVPPAPDPPIITNIGQTSLHSRYYGNGTGVGTFSKWQTGWALSSGGTITWVDGYDIDMTNLPSGATLYIYGRGINSVGNGDLSQPTVAVLIAGGWLNVNGVWKRATPFVKVNGVWKPARAWSKLEGFWRESL